MVITPMLRRIIEDEQYTINSLAVAAGLPQPVLSRFMSGQTSLNGESIDKLAEYLGVELKQVIYWDEYVDELRESGAMGDAWKQHETDAWAEYETDAWRAYESEAWSEYESEAWPEALTSGDWTEEQHEEWRDSEYDEWYDNEYDEWYDNEYSAWYDSEYPEWEDDYLQDVREGLEKRDYVVILVARE